MVIKNNRWMVFNMDNILVHDPSAIRTNFITLYFIGDAVSIPITLIL